MNGDLPLNCVRKEFIMTRPNRYSKKNHFKTNRGNPERNMGKQELGKVVLPWHYHVMLQEFNETAESIKLDTGSSDTIVLNTSE